MTILFVAPYYGPVHSSGRLWVKWLRRLGNEVTVFDYRQAVLPERWYAKVRGGRRIQRFLMQFRFLQVTTQRHYDLIFILKGETIYPQTLRRLREKHKGLLINWMGDADPLSRFPTVRNSLPFYDIFFVIDKGLIQQFKQLGYDRVEYLPYGCDPEVHRRVRLSDDDWRKFGTDLCYVGWRDERREQVIASLDGYQMKIWHHSWYKSRFPSIRALVAGGALDETEMVKAFNAARIVLNPQPAQLITGVNYKTHEIAGCGAFQLTDWKEELAEMYELGKEVVCFRTLEELRELIDYYLRNEGERRRIAEAAQRRAYADHTLERRAQKLLQIVREA